MTMSTHSKDTGGSRRQSAVPSHDVAVVYPFANSKIVRATAAPNADSPAS